MTYEERVNKITELAGDYNKIIADFNLEKALYNSIRSTADENLRQLLESLSLGDLHISITNGGYLTATKDGWGAEECLYKYSFFSYRHPSGDAEETLKDALGELLLRLISSIAKSGNYSVSDVARLAGYASLIMVNADIDAAKAVKKIFDDYKQANERYKEKDIQHKTYINAISQELYPLAQEWYKEKAVLAPGMKIGIINLKTGEVTVRTIKRFKKTENSLSIAFNETSSIVTDPSRIHIELTWYLNNGECSDIAKAIKWSPIAGFV